MNIEQMKMAWAKIKEIRSAMHEAEVIHGNYSPANDEQTKICKRLARIRSLLEQLELEIVPLKWWSVHWRD